MLLVFSGSIRAIIGCTWDSASSLCLRIIILCLPYYKSPFQLQVDAKSHAYKILPVNSLLTLILCINMLWFSLIKSGIYRLDRDLDVHYFNFFMLESIWLPLCFSLHALILLNYVPLQHPPFPPMAWCFFPCLILWCFINSMIVWFY